ncbi:MULTISPECIES: SMC-Scp complex subunit ScpB [unclassified Beijerinckia]|uniref:SMC-Scp complex subunit ScpB n=1 Tax=unclassified Beijerinckia TaxID=2638183 RepID=UPI0008962DB4|nr:MULTISPECIES: SMC-Scp complex subunit ScpB [unclassified Beijerinckia]MDH7795646.1 segregation and condensation protein B [Beijerinckia sp. GAS462]SEC10086.1 condensin subunit ScpB [Beijerinckia sp. 28-YEA-48]
MGEAAEQLPFEGEDAMNAAAEAHREAMRIAEAILFAATEPMEEAEIGRRLPEGTDVGEVMLQLREEYAHRGVNLVRVARKWLFRTATDLGWLLSRDVSEQKKLSKAALETLAIVAYHQPVTRAEVEDIRGVAISKGTLDVLLETGWVRLRGRRKAPGRPVTYGTTEAFLLQFGLEQITDLPGLEDLRSAGLFDGRLPQGFGIPKPSDDSALTEDEDPLEGGETTDLFTEPANGEAEAEAGTEAEAQAEVEARAETQAEIQSDPLAEVEAETETETTIEAGAIAEVAETGEVVEVEEAETEEEAAEAEAVLEEPAAEAELEEPIAEVEEESSSEALLEESVSEEPAAEESTDEEADEPQDTASDSDKDEENPSSDKI